MWVSFFNQTLEKVIEVNEKLNPLNFPDLDWQDYSLGILSAFGMVKLPEAESDFVLGENLATTEGYVIYENQFCQLIRYTQKETRKYNEPIFIVPPWINKYYIFDLSSEKSIIRWLCEQGYEVYCLSWANADETYKNVSLEDYIENSILKAIHFINQKKIHAIGYCIGGVGLALSVLSEKKYFKTLTFLATPFDFKAMKTLNSYMSENYRDFLEMIIQKEGYLHGERLYQLFSQLKATEMIYQDIIDRIYLKKEIKLIDYLHWNADVSNIPGKVHLDYIKDIYLKNNLCDRLKKEKIKIPTFIACAKKDHIVPYDASSCGFQAFQNAVLCCGKGGHVAGFVHDITSDKFYHILVGEKENAVQKKGSWWLSWKEWVQGYSKAYQPSKYVEFESIEAAPGRYVLQKPKPLDCLFWA